MNSGDSSAYKLFPAPTRAQALWPLLFWFALGIPTLVYPFGRDQGVFAYVGRKLFEGERLYVDIWDVKSPLVYWLYGLIDKLGGSGEVGLRVADMLLALVIAYLVYALTSSIRKENSGATGAFAAVIYLLWYYLPNDFRVLSNSEVYFVPFALLGALLLAHALSRPAKVNWRSIFWAGVFLGLGPLVKTTAAGFLPAAALAVWIQPGISMRNKFTVTLLLGAGFVLPLAFGWLYLLRTGALEEWWYLNAVYLPSYTSMSHGGVVYTIKTAAHFIKDLTFIYPALTAGALLFALRFRKLRNPALDVTALFGFVYLGVIFLQGKFLHYHLLPLLPFFSSLLATTVMATIEDLRSKALLRYSAVVVSALALNYIWLAPERAVDFAKVALGGKDARAEYREKLTRGNYPLVEVCEVADYLRKHSSANERLFVWSFEPELYYFSRMDHASKFIFNTPLFAGDIAKRWKRELMAELSATPPKYIVIGTADGLPLIAGADYSSADRLVEVPGLVEFIDSRYEEVARIGRFVIYKQRTFASGDSTPSQTQMTRDT